MPPTYKIGDPVQTPCGRRGRIIGLRSDGRLDIQYQDAAGGDVALLPEKVVLIVHSKSKRPWPSRIA